MTEIKFQRIIIMGAGPAGVLLACLLRQKGYKDVTIISRPRPSQIWEGVSERVFNILSSFTSGDFNFKHTLKVFDRPVKRHATWNYKTIHQGSEYIVERTAFDKALLQDAADAGLKVISGRIFSAEKHGTEWTVIYNGGTAKADFIVEARGKEAKLYKEAKNLEAPRTTAIAKRYRTKANTLPPMTAVASYDQGWAWFMRDLEGQISLQIFVNSAKGELPSKNNLEAFFEDQLRRIEPASLWLEGAKEVNSPLTVRHISFQKNTQIIGDDYLLIGDAAMTIDPLSGNGVFYAISSALAAAPTLNTILMRPENKKNAFRFYKERLDLIFDDVSHKAKEFYQTEEQWQDKKFWKIRSGWPREWPKEWPDKNTDPSNITPKRVLKDVVSHDFIEQKSVILTSEHPRGIWHFSNIPLAQLLEYKKQNSYGDEALREKFKATNGQLQAAVKWLEEQGLL
jgi:flavin-dependent dehydrogenase